MRVLIALCLWGLAAASMAAESFLEPEEISKLEPHPDVPGASRHIMEGADPSKYSKMIVGAVTFYFAEDSKAKDIDADEAKQISDAMKSALISAAADKVDVVLTAGPETALINVAITDINMQNKKRGLLGYTPVGLVISTAGNLANMRMQLKDARIEGEVVDSVSGQRISVFRIDDIGDWDDKKDLSWEDLRASLESSLAKGLAAIRP